VTGCKSVHKSFDSIEKARDYIEQNGFARCTEIIKETALETTPTRNNMAYYAVANGAKPGIYDVW
jgi:viroplasmin and RNaseH domain-containing protein